MNRYLTADGTIHVNICPTRVGMNRVTLPELFSPDSICPTRVGMNRTEYATERHWKKHLPHTRGDEPRFE